jgi:HD superfamily phosphodiesterase
MEDIFKKIWELSKPYLNTRKNDMHTKISLNFAYKLMEKEGGDEGIVVPAVILHDVGWKRVPEKLQLQAFGPKATSPELNRVHEIEGSKIAKEILKKLSYHTDSVEDIIEIIEGHDSRKEALSLNDKLVKDADKLCRYTKEGLRIDVDRFGETCDEGIDRLERNLERWFFTASAKEMARKEMQSRIRENQAAER